MKKIIKYSIVLVAVSALAGCTKEFGDYNTNPYEPMSIPVASYLPGMIDCMASPEENPCQRNNTFWASLGGYVTTPHSWSKANHFYTFNQDDDWNQWSFNWYFSEKIYPNWFAVQRNTDGSGYYFSMAQLFRIYAMQIIASSQGPMPYTQIKDGNFYVAYDDEKTVWHAMMDDLDVVIRDLKDAVSQSLSMSEFAAVDRVYRGDNEKWLKFANTLKLRMAMRISNIEPEYAKEKAEEAVRDGVMTSASEGAYDNLDNRYQNGYYVLDKGWGGEVKANACIVSYMSGYNDPRMEKYFYKSLDTKVYQGLRNGVQGRVKGSFTNYSGVIWGGDDSYKYAPMPIMLASEAAFLMAEGALKGWSMGDTAQNLYEKGVELSFEEWGVENAASAVKAYLADNKATPGDFKDPTYPAENITNKSEITIAWDESADPETKLERIITQKWIAGFPNGQEAWADFHRTGYPYIFPPKDNLSGGIVTDAEYGARRVRFPLSEYQRNTANVNAAIQMLSTKKDDIGANLWWAGTVNKYK